MYEYAKNQCVILKVSFEAVNEEKIANKQDTVLFAVHIHEHPVVADVPSVLYEDDRMAAGDFHL